MITQIRNDYPPENHLLRDMRILFAFDGDERAEIRAPVVPEICTRHGSVRVGVMATLVDVLGGILSVRALHPDWMATASLSIHTSGRVEKGWVTASGRVIRNGRTITVIHVDIYGQGHAPKAERIPAGTALMTFSRLPVKGKPVLGEPHAYSDQTIDFSLPGSGFDRPILEKAGVHIRDEEKGIVTMDLNPYVRNSINCLQGGMVATMAEVAGNCAAGAALGLPVHTRDLVLNYLSLGRVGPIETRPTLVRHDQSSALTRIEVVDTGVHDRLMAVVMNTGFSD